MKKPTPEKPARATKAARRKRKPEAVDHPKHYNSGKIEVIDFIEDQSLGFNDGNAVKYIARARHKGTELEDLKKAVWYLNRQIAILPAALKTKGRRK